MKKIQAFHPTKGFVDVLVDEEDYQKYKDLTLRVQKTGHVYLNGRGRTSIHRDIIGCPPSGMVVDHVNRNPLDNRRENLRFVSFADNAANRSLPTSNTSGYKGVINLKGGYYAILQVGGKSYYSTGHETAESAANSYDWLVSQYMPNGTTNRSLGLLQENESGAGI